MKKSKLLTVLISLILALFLLSAAIACPILIRAFYYAQIQSLFLPEKTGYSEEEIRKAYDEMMDYTAGGGEASGKTFGTGKLIWSEAGKAHFDDVAGLFRLDFVIAGITGGLLLLYLAVFLFRRRKRSSEGESPADGNSFLPYRPLGRGPLFWGPVGLGAVMAVIGGMAAFDFSRFFTAFHHLFFPGKENWIFDPEKDAIIRILPEEVFRNFAIYALVILLAGCLLCILADFVTGKRAAAEKREEAGN